MGAESNHPLLPGESKTKGCSTTRLRRFGRNDISIHTTFSPKRKRQAMACRIGEKG
jgi:hypothetical protein